MRKDILIYGAMGGVLIAFLKLIEYRFLNGGSDYADTAVSARSRTSSA